MVNVTTVVRHRKQERPHVVQHESVSVRQDITPRQAVYVKQVQQDFADSAPVLENEKTQQGDDEQTARRFRIDSHRLR